MTGKSREEAINIALSLNRDIKKHQGRFKNEHHLPNLIDRFIKDYLPIKQYAPSTQKGIITKLNRLKIEFADESLRNISVLTLKDFLEPLTPHSRKHNRLLWIDIYKYALSEGLCEHNLAERTLTKKIPKRQRDRLTLQQFNGIYDISPEWFKIAMRAQLLTLQRRDDLVNLKFTDYKDGVLKLIQSKTGTGLKITANSELESLFKRSRQTNTPSPYLIHKKPRSVRKEYIDQKAHWTQVTPEMLTRTFKKYRDDAKIETSATWYEIKSLGGRLLIEQGFDAGFVQLLMGHANQSTTQIYLDDGINWTQAESGLKL